MSRFFFWCVERQRSKFPFHYLEILRIGLNERAVGRRRVAAECHGILPRDDNVGIDLCVPGCG
jgi:hypothetical protein